MFIKNLRIRKENEIIRDINFHKGINLIIDETKTSDKKESGNNVGKTTILRLIDYCLGSSGKNIYSDPEFKKVNASKIERFLKTNNIKISLTLVKDLDNENSKKIVIERNFLLRKEKISTINGNQFTNINGCFLPELKNLIYNSENKKPTFKQIISKNIRDEKSRLQHTIKTLHPTTTDQEYEALYLFWLGIDLDSMDKKQELIQKKNLEEKLQKKLLKNTSESELEQSLLIIGENIQELEKKKEESNINENYESDLNELNRIKSKLVQLSTELSQLELREELIIESKINLENEKTNININEIKQFYNEAKKLVPSIQKTFEETIEFHNEMISEKIEYITSEIPEINSKKNSLKLEIKDLVSKEKKLTKLIKKSDLMIEVEDIFKELNKLYEQKGKFKEQQNRLIESTNELKRIDLKLDTINKVIDEKDKLIKERITIFNKYFSEISYKLYGEKFILSDFKKNNSYDLKISSIEGNLGTGKKKGQIVAFDLAYIKFAEELGVDKINFILHDQIENVHSNQIESMLTEIIEEIDCQFIIPVLKDKLPENIDIENMKIITLSQEDKLFKI